MARVSTYLNFDRRTEEAFNFYKSVFGGEFESFQRMGEVPEGSGPADMSEDDKNLVMHVDLPIFGGHHLMGTDGRDSVTVGDNIALTLEPDSLEETQRLFDALKDGGEVRQELKKEFWGAYYGELTDKFGVRWMFNFQA